VNIDVRAAAVSGVEVIVVQAVRRRSCDWNSESDAANLLLVRNVRVTVVVHQLVECGELDVFEIEGGRRTLHVEVLDARRVPAPAHHQQRTPAYRVARQNEVRLFT